MSKFAVGARVNLSEKFKGVAWIKVGNVVKLNHDGSRTRVKWDYWLYPDGHRRPDGKRTWVKTTRLEYPPSEIVESEARYTCLADLPTDVQVLYGKGWYVVAHGTTIDAIFPNRWAAQDFLEETLTHEPGAYVLPTKPHGV